MSAPWLSVEPGGVVLSLLVVPRASRSKVVGPHAEWLKVQLAAPPVDGAANQALIELLCTTLKVPKRQITLVSGETSRRKRVRVEGVEPASVEAVMNAGR